MVGSESVVIHGEIVHATVPAVEAEAAARGLEIVVAAVPVQQVVVAAAKIAHAAVSHHCTGMCHHPALNISRHCNIKQCRQLDKSQPILWPIRHRLLYQWSGPQSRGKPDGKRNYLYCHIYIYIMENPFISTVVVVVITVCMLAIFLSGWPKKKWWNISINRCICQAWHRQLVIQYWPAKLIWTRILHFWSSGNFLL